MTLLFSPSGQLKKLAIGEFLRRRMKLEIRNDSIDYSNKLDNFANPTTEFDFGSDDFAIGFHKPLKNIYIEMDTREDVSILTVQYWNGTAWAPIDNVIDLTFGLNNSGLISWPEAVKHVRTDYSGTGEKYWVRLLLDNAPAGVMINGINLVLSNDSDLSFVPNIGDYLPENSTSFIAFHQEARNIIVQMLRNSGKKISKIGTFFPIELGLNLRPIDTRQVDQFDLLEIEEFHNASKYLALHLIFDYMSKSDEDAYFQKSKRYYERFLDSYNSNLVTIDSNDSGETDATENLAIQFIRIQRE